MVQTTTPRPEPSKIIIAVHHTAVSRGVQPLQYDAVDNFHRRKNWGTAVNPWYQPSASSLGKWGGYNVFVEPTGQRQWYRRYGEETIAQRGYNCTSLGNCAVLSYCMAGDFRVEKPTAFQVSDLVMFVDEVKAAYPNIMLEVQQHSDLDANRTCAELSPQLIASWFLKTGISKDQIISALRAENDKLKREHTQLRGLVTTLIKIITR